ncbi:MAG: translation elongation factor Ts [Deltaproteobacteria bacterium]|nr:translation elongation factor Ts [Deltaproteobacteria bacterium]
MAEINAKMVKELRDRTLAGFADCKKALVQCDGDMDKAADFLRKKGIVTAQKKAGRTAASGLVHSYIHQGGKIGVLVEVNCETDFVAKNDAFIAFTHEVAIQIAAMNPSYLTPEDVPEEVVAKEREIRMAAAREGGKPEKVIDKIVDGQIRKWYTEICLLEQAYVKEAKKQIKELVTELVATLGENCKVRRFARWEVGEGIEVKKQDYAEEIAQLAGGK